MARQWQDLACSGWAAQREYDRRPTSADATQRNLDAWHTMSCTFASGVTLAKGCKDEMS